MRRLLNSEVARFLALGGLAAAINWLVRFPLSMIFPLWLAVVVAYIIGMSAGFHLYRRYVFPKSSRSLMCQSLVFVAVNLAGAGIVLAATLLLLVAQGGLSWPQSVKEGLAHGLAIAIGAAVNFLGHKFLTFAGGPALSPDAAR